MALSAGTVFEINSSATASNVNGGGFNPFNANFMTDLTTDSNTANTAAPVVSSASYNFAAGDVNHWLYIQSGTDWTPGWYKIQSVASNKATLEAAVGSANVRQISQNNLYGANTVIGCATVGTPTGGVFSIDYSQSTASPFASTDIATASNTTLTSATNPFGKNMVGNLLHVTAGTGFTAGWYEIVSVSGTTATIDRSIGTHPLTNGTGKVGGALSLGGSNDDAVFKLSVGSATKSGRFFIKNGTYTLGGNISSPGGGDTRWPVIWEGYATNRGDRPTSSTRPTLAAGSNQFTMGSLAAWYCLNFTTTEAAGIVLGSGQYLEYCKFYNSSETASRVAAEMAGSSSTAVLCEFMSLRGTALKLTAAADARLIGCRMKDSNIGIDGVLGGADFVIQDCIIENCVSKAINCPAVNSNGVIAGNTLYGAENKLGVGITFASGTDIVTVFNNIFYGFTTAVSNTTSGTRAKSNFNNYYNNTNDVNAAANWQKNPNDIALNPTFTNVTQRTGSTATTTSGNHLVQTGATFQTWGVQAGDILQIVSGTGPTAGLYTISSVDSETQVTVNQTLTANATANKVWQITQGRNFAVGSPMKAVGLPGLFPGGLTTSYTDIGAVQILSPNYNVIGSPFVGVS